MNCAAARQRREMKETAPVVSLKRLRMRLHELASSCLSTAGKQLRANCVETTRRAVAVTNVE
jgi:hypothetical protein